MTTIFGKIIKGELPCEKVFENDRIIVIKDIHPVAPIHLLIIPKKEIANLQSATAEDQQLLGEMLLLTQKLAKEFNIEEGYRVIINNGNLAGQIIYHLHLHLIGGKPLGHKLVE